MSNKLWKIYTAAALVGCTILLGVAHLVIFHDRATLTFYLALDIVFVPVQVLLVSFIIEKFLDQREKEEKLKKLYMVIGAFFGEVGNPLLRQFCLACVDASSLARLNAIDKKWAKTEYTEARSLAQEYRCRIGDNIDVLQNIKGLLLEKRNFILMLLQNPNLLEHDELTDLLWSVCHLTEELDVRADIQALPASDLQHLEGDIQRAFGLILYQWLAYVQHLRQKYPYMHSLAMRMNPFDPNASPIVTD